MSLESQLFGRAIEICKDMNYEEKTSDWGVFITDYDASKTGCSLRYSLRASRTIKSTKFFSLKKVKAFVTMGFDALLKS